MIIMLLWIKHLLQLSCSSSSIIEIAAKFNILGQRTCLGQYQATYTVYHIFISITDDLLHCPEVKWSSQAFCTADSLCNRLANSLIISQSISFLISHISLIFISFHIPHLSSVPTFCPNHVLTATKQEASGVLAIFTTHT